ncbi:MAG: cobalamin-dependent protein [Acidobacteriota bacterium]
MKILLVAPASGRWKKIGESRIFNGKTFRFSLLSLLSVAAETPRDAEIRIIDEQIDEIPWDEEFDLVGITCMTAIVLRAYEISAAFRKRGIPVVLGGMHPTFRPQEALCNADAVVMGDAEGIWPQVLKDAANGRLHGIYRNECPPSLIGLNPPPRHLLKGKKYGTIQAVQATRGCSNSCDFCSVSAFNHQTQRFRPVREVVDEITSLRERLQKIPASLILRREPDVSGSLSAWKHFPART